MTADYNPCKTGGLTALAAALGLRLDASFKVFLALTIGALAFD
jgi:hypothetical protein